MDFLDPKKKRAHNIRLYVGYALTAVALGMSTLVLVFAAYGYSIDRNTGDVIQNGLLIIDAHPESATIFVDGKSQGTTDSRLILPAGKYKLELQRQGYRSWTHSVNLEGSSIEQLVYPILFPSNLVSKTIQQYSAVPAMASESPDRHWFVVQQPNSTSSFDVVDLSTTKNAVTPISLPADTFNPAAGVHTYEAVEWSTDNAHLLLKHIFAGGSEFIMLDRGDPVASVNLNKVFTGQSFTSVTLRDKKADQLYLLNNADGGLLQADIKSRATTPVQTKVLSYKSYQSNTLLYVTASAKDTSQVEVRVREGDKDYLLRNLPIAGSYLLEMAQFNGHFYLVSGSTADGRAYVYKDVLDELGDHPANAPKPFRVLVVAGAQYVSFSAIARFVAVQGGSNFTVYDFETNRQSRYDTKLPLAANQKASWMDGHRLSLVSEGFVNIFDFDGTNNQKLSTSFPAFTPFFDRDYTAMFTLNVSADKTNITRTELKVLPPGQSGQ